MSECTCPFRWTTHYRSCPMSAEVLYIRSKAAEVYTPEGVDIWMQAPNRSLNNATPLQFIASGDAERVLNLIQALAEGVMD